jgi:hypothetical protein
MTATPYAFLGAAIAAVTSAYLCQQAWREGRGALAWAMGVASGAFFLAALDVYAWTDDRHIFSVLVWPSLEVPSEAQKATHMQRERARQVIRVINAGAAEMAWSTRYEVTYGLEWDYTRQVWTGEDGFAYDSPPERIEVGE